MDNKLLDPSNDVEFNLETRPNPKKNMKKALSLVTVLALAISASAQTNQAWLVSDSKLLLDGGTFEIVLTPNTGVEDRAVTIRINPDDKTITYNKLSSSAKLPGLPVTIDLSNQSEKQALVALLEVYKENAAGQALAHLMGNDGSVHSMIADARHRAAFKTAVDQYSGALGQCVGFSEFYDSRPDQPLCFTFRGRFDLVDLVLPEPAALLWTINHQGDFLQLRTAALKKKQEIELAAQQAAEAKHQAELAAIKAAEDEREKAHQEELRKLGQKAEVAKQEAVGAEREQQRNQELAQAKQARAKEYLRTFSGFMLAGKIGNLTKEINTLYREETEYLRKNKEVLDQTMKNSTDLTLPGYARDFSSSQLSDMAVQQGVLAARHKESDKLKVMRGDLDKLLDKFKNTCGVSYKEAWDNGGKDIIKNAMAIRRSIFPTLFILMAGILIYRAAQQDKRGMAPKWYLMSKPLAQKLKNVFARKTK